MILPLPQQLYIEVQRRLLEYIPMIPKNPRRKYILGVITTLLESVPLISFSTFPCVGTFSLRFVSEIILNSFSTLSLIKGLSQT